MTCASIDLSVMVETICVWRLLVV